MWLRPGPKTPSASAPCLCHCFRYSTTPSRSPRNQNCCTGRRREAPPSSVASLYIRASFQPAYPSAPSPSNLTGAQYSNHVRRPPGFPSRHAPETDTLGTGLLDPSRVSPGSNSTILLRGNWEPTNRPSAVKTNSPPLSLFQRPTMSWVSGVRRPQPTSGNTIANRRMPVAATLVANRIAALSITSQPGSFRSTQTSATSAKEAPLASSRIA